MIRPKARNTVVMGDFCAVVGEGKRMDMSAIMFRDIVVPMTLSDL